VVSLDQSDRSSRQPGIWVQWPSVVLVYFVTGAGTAARTAPLWPLCWTSPKASGKVLKFLSKTPSEQPKVS